MIIRPFGDVRTIISIWSSARVRSVSTNFSPQLAACVTSSGMLPSSTSSMPSLVLADASLSGIAYRFKCLFCGAFFAVFQEEKSQLLKAGKEQLVTYFEVPLSGCSSNGLCGDVQMLKEAGMTAKRSKWDFARDGTTFLVKVNNCF